MNDAATLNVVDPDNITLAPVNTSGKVAASVSYTLANRAYTITVGGRSQVFLPADIDPDDTGEGLEAYYKGTATTADGLLLTKPYPDTPVDLDYVGAGLWQHAVAGATDITSSIDAFTYGLATSDAATPRSGRAEYGVTLIGAKATSLGIDALVGGGTTQVDFAKGVLVTHGTVDTAYGERGFSSEARMSSSQNRFSGVFRYNEITGQFTGELDGRFYGPAAQELGGAFHATTADGKAMAGVILGGRETTPAVNTSLTPLTSNEFLANDAGVLNATLTGTLGMNTTSGTFSGRSQAISPLIVNYDASNDSYTLIGVNRSAYFNDGNDIAVDHMYDAPIAGGLALQYVHASRWWAATPGAGVTTSVATNFAYGVETPNAALPRTGGATYGVRVSGVAADSDFFNFMQFEGSGSLNANFATGALTATGSVNYQDVVPVPRVFRTGAFNLTATLSSSANAFNGAIDLSGVGAYQGALAGRFYGPAAQEVGAAFVASDGAGGGMSGVLVGKRAP